MRLMATSVAVLVLFAGSVPAAEFGDADADGDGVLSFSEFASVYPELPESTFKLIDIDETGTVTESELADAVNTGVLQPPEG